MSKFLSIREAASNPACPIREGTLRAMVKRQEVPGFYRGRNFWVDFDGLLEVLKDMSRANVKPQKE